MKIAEDLGHLIDWLINTDLIKQPENYKQDKDEAIEKLVDAQDILEKLGL